ncbi:probable ATP-dependent RNA helicase DDX4 isoform X2 [Excalfactoria chinensis]|uniref:probable ATP-dependent RNA helicase DDX4 isoform X2 n=1 Tax=Excalfactoria chinensis TaxID=46218 RepID=UPI003B3B9C35
MEEDWDLELLEQEAAAAPLRRPEEQQVWSANSGRPNSPSHRFSSRPSSPLSGLPGRPNSPFFGFSQNKGSLGANEGLNRSLHAQRGTRGCFGGRDSVVHQNREDQPVTRLGRGRSFGSRDFQERNSTNDPGMREQGFRRVPGSFGQSKSFNSEERNSPLRGNPFAAGVRGAAGGLAGVHKGHCEEIDSGRGPKVTYVPPPPPDDEQSIFACYQTGINFDKYDECTADMSGIDPPSPLLAAFLLPIVDQMMKDGVTASVFQKQQEPRCIIVAPTRELINQIFLEARKFVYGTCIRPVVIYGGTQTGHSIRQIMQGCNILCATPGRLLDIIEKGKISLVEVKYLVLDEADRMLDMGFGLDMKKLISYPDMPAKDRRQTLMFSATFPEEVQRLAGEFLKTDYIFLVIGNTCGACSDVQQNILQVPRLSKRDKLIEILQSTGGERTMVFVDTKKKADYLAAFLCQENLPSTSIHGDREQREREIALRDFRSGKCQILVATSVAARGLDIENVQHVINFDLPNTIEDYVHRIGRTGRCGNPGKAVSFFDDQSDGHLVQSLLKVLSEAQQEVPVWLEEMAVEGTNTVPSLGARRINTGSSRVNPGEKRMSYTERTFQSWE